MIIMSKSKFKEFHVPFIKSLLFVAVVTVASMVSVHYYLKKPLSPISKTPTYTSQESQYESK
jgi:hypothetical protein